MRKFYAYKDLEFPIKEETEVAFSVELVSDGTIISTAINIPDVPPEGDPIIEDAGSVLIGKGKDLIDKTTFVFSDVINLIPQEDQITIHYKVNGELLLAHNNPKSEEVRPYVLLDVKFVKP